MNVKIERVEIEDCFFTAENGLNDPQPGWIVAKIELPYTIKSGNLYLTLSILGEKYWVESKKVYFRDSGYEGFKSEKALNFDWSKYKKFPLPDFGDAPITHRCFRSDSNNLNITFESFSKSKN